MAKQYGATPEQWDHLSLVLGLTKDLLPVVSNPNAQISPDSKIKALGKTPSRYNRERKVAGIAQWTSHQATPADINSWRKQPDYGICIQTRTIRALDIDCEDAVLVKEILHAIPQHLPMRWRSTSPKCLLTFNLPGDMPKRVIRLKNNQGIIEFLATGQQFIALGMHPSLAPYRWGVSPSTKDSGLPNSIPDISLPEFEALWSSLASQFGESTSTSNSPTKAKVLAETISSDPTAQFLFENGWVKSTEKDGRLHITCPFEEEHTSESADSATSYFPPHTGGYEQGHFKCLHAHCENRTDDEFKVKIGLPHADPFDDFDVIPVCDSQTANADIPAPTKPARFHVIPASEFAEVKPSGWIVKNVLPRAEMGVIYGDSGAGKTFFILDLVGSIAQGLPWRGHTTKQGACVYVCAEGAGGFRGRLKAYSVANEVPLASLPIGVVADAPNLMQVQDTKDLILAIRHFGKPSLVVIDTFAQVMAGANENAGEDVGKALSHCKQIHKHTGAMVVLIHHSGKDASKGARGWSGLRAAAEFEMEVSRCDDDRVATLSKLKDGQDGLEFGFKLKTVSLGVVEDADGELDEVTSCVIEYTEGVVRKAAAKGKRGNNEKLVMQVLLNLIELGDDRVQYTDLLAGCISQMVPPMEGKRDRRSEIVSQAVDSLRDKGDIQVENGFIKVAQNEAED